mmetsp:Transcript_44558/g.93505  ORF Transcript_44558/g.93505 Transcript_44558/m.93505 type:complete len:109 (-) Transcript_44558:492-818(-)
MPPPEGVAKSQTSTREEVLSDGTRVVHTTTIETYPDGSQCKRTVTKRTDVTEEQEENVGRPSVGVSMRNFRFCFCFKPCACFKCCCKDDESESDDEESDLSSSEDEDE